MSKKLSLVPYYGGKNKMCEFIADKLNYDCDIYIEPFGGAASVLLNKPKHKIEIYNDYGYGITNLMKVMSNEKKAREFLYSIRETEYSEEEFERAKDIYWDAELTNGGLIEKEIQKVLRSIKLIDNEREIDKRFFKGMTVDTIYEMLFDEIKEKNTGKHIKKDYTEDEIEEVEKIKNLLENIKELDGEKSPHLTKLNDLLDKWYMIYDADDRVDVYVTNDNGKKVILDEMKSAKVTYITYAQSRDGMGKAFSRGKTTQQYRKKIESLLDVADRLKDVMIINSDANKVLSKADKNSKGDKWDILEILNDLSVANKDKLNDLCKLKVKDFVNNPNVMIYCDPSYISPKAEERLLKYLIKDEAKKNKLTKQEKQELLKEKIRASKNLADDIKKAIDKEKKKLKAKKVNKNNQPKNLGEAYVKSFDYEDQEDFLKNICHAKACVIVSNYDLVLYNKYLNEENGWKKIEFDTVTTVGNKIHNKRKEILWYNYEWK